MPIFATVKFWSHKHFGFVQVDCDCPPSIGNRCTEPLHNSQIYFNKYGLKFVEETWSHRPVFAELSEECCDKIPEPQEGDRIVLDRVILCDDRKSFFCNRWSYELFWNTIQDEISSQLAELNAQLHSSQQVVHV